MDRIEIKKTIAIVAIKLIVLQLVFAIIYLAISLIGDSIEQYNNGTFMNLITYDSLTFIIVAILHMLLTLHIVLEWAMEKYTLLPNKIKHQWGILFRKTEYWEITNIETAYVTESITARLLNYGTITFHSPTLETHVILRDVPSPSLIVNSVEKNLSALGKNKIVYLGTKSK